MMKVKTSLLALDIAKSAKNSLLSFFFVPTRLTRADDLILMSETKEGLDALLKILEIYCGENHLLINTKKTKCMVFNKSGRLISRPFYLDGTKLGIVQVFGIRYKTLRGDHHWFEGSEGQGIKGFYEDEE